jgi:hypothetical protein
VVSGVPIHKGKRKARGEKMEKETGEQERKKPVRFLLDGGMSVSCFFPEREGSLPYFIAERRYLRRQKGKEEWMTAKTWRARDLVTLAEAVPEVVNFEGNRKPGDKVDLRTKREGESAPENGNASAPRPADGAST